MYFNGIQCDAPDDAAADARCGYTIKKACRLSPHLLPYVSRIH